jgi:hypothetical protein
MGAVKGVMTMMSTVGPAIQAVLAVGSTATSYLSAQGQADAQEQMNANANEQARQFMINDYDQMTMMSQQNTAAASQKLNDNEKAARKAAASATVAASAGGVQGLSVDALLADVYGQEASIRDSVNQNLENTGHQLQYEREGIRNGYLRQQASNPVVERPSALGALFEGASGVYGAYKDSLKVRNKSNKTGGSQNGSTTG